MQTLASPRHFSEKIAKNFNTKSFLNLTWNVSNIQFMNFFSFWRKYHELISKWHQEAFLIRELLTPEMCDVCRMWCCSISLPQAPQKDILSEMDWRLWLNPEEYSAHISMSTACVNNVEECLWCEKLYNLPFNFRQEKREYKRWSYWILGSFCLL